MTPWSNDRESGAGGVKYPARRSVGGKKAEREEEPRFQPDTVLSSDAGSEGEVLERVLGERKRAEEALKALAAENSLILDSTIDLVIYLDEAMRILWVNREARNSAGMRLEEMVGRLCWEIWHQRTEACSGCPVIEALKTGEPREAEINSPDGRQWHIRGFPVKDEEGKIKGVTEFCLDITERKRMERALRESEVNFAAVFRATPSVLVISTVAEGRYIEVNEAFERVLGYRQEEVIGRTSLELDIWEAPEARAGFIRLLQERGRVRDLEAGFRGKTGEIFVGLVSAEAIEVRGEKRLLVLVNDITARKRAEEQSREFNEILERRVAERTAELEEINRELESFCYTISHDLRAPLRAIDGFTHILNEEHAAAFDADGRQLCRRISDSAVRMGELIDDLLTFSRVGRAALQADTIEMTDLVRAVFDEVVPEEARRRIELRLAPLPSAMGDRVTLRQVWTNLIDNAVKYSSSRPRQVIEIGGEQTETETVFRVRDNGIGFDMAYVDKLFGVFERLHGAAEFRGTGVGLAIVSRIVQRHGGRVWAEGRVDQGATLYFSLPLQLRSRGTTSSGNRRR